MHPDREGLYIETGILTVLLLAALYAAYRAYNHIENIHLGKEINKGKRMSKKESVYQARELQPVPQNSTVDEPVRIN